MKDEKTKNIKKITKLTHKGISLIVLLVTIIVIITLVAVIILTITQNNLVNSAKEAVFREDINNFETELEIYKSNMKYKGENPEELNANKETAPDIQEVITSMSNKYAKVLEVRNGKLVYIGKDKVGYKLAYKIGILPKDELIDDEIIEELQPFITEWTVEDGDSITLPISGYVHNKYNFTVDYGDGTDILRVTNSDFSGRMHTYEKAGKYLVTIKGQCPDFGFWSSGGPFTAGIGVSKDKITRIVQWGNVFKNPGGYQQHLEVSFNGCKNLVGPIPEPSKSTFENVQALRFLFSNCSSLNCEIPENLLYNCPKLTSINSIFSGASFVGAIPENLFKNCNKIDDFSNAFSNCKKLSQFIPDRLFANCVSAKNFSNTFNGCNNLTGSIPENLFRNNLKVNNFNQTFRNCINISGSIPEKLFANCPEVTSFDGTFRDCISISGSIPENLFSNCTEVTNFVNTFSGCRKLNGEIPSKLFSSNTKVISFGYDWYQGTFYNCSGLTGGIPEELFANCQDVVNFKAVFSGCTGLNGTIPSNLFENNRKIIHFQNAFYGCKNLIGSAPALWELENISSKSGCFANCSKLNNYSEIPSDWK